MKKYRIGTRGSPLASWQAEWVEQALRAHHPEVEFEIVKIRTLAEKLPDREVPEIGVGIFTREIDEALLRGEIDLAVHSLKDVPSEIPAGIVLAAVPERESPLDAFIGAKGISLEDLPRGARVGTGSPRRKAQLLHRRPDLGIVPLRGNVATRLRKMEEEGLAGIVLAHAGLKRLGEEVRITHLIPPEVLLPAAGQGALAVSARAGDGEVEDLVRPLEHAPSRARVTAERSFLRQLRGGCQVPAGALAELANEDWLRISGVVAAPDGSAAVRGEISESPEEAERCGRQLADEILERGGATILKALERKGS
jgi:hydroxymethylbilane synthase